ncbi:MAG: STAS domain-containing protein [Acidobacteriota bacterium]
MDTPRALTVAEGTFGVTPGIRLAGQLVFGHDLDALREAVNRVASAGYRQLVVDLAAVDRFDSSGIATILDIKSAMGDAVERIVLLDVPERLQRALANFGVTSLFVTAARQSDTVRALGAWRPKVVRAGSDGLP